MLKLTFVDAVLSSDTSPEYLVSPFDFRFHPLVWSNIIPSPKQGEYSLLIQKLPLYRPVAAKRAMLDISATVSRRVAAI